MSIQRSPPNKIFESSPDLRQLEDMSTSCTAIRKRKQPFVESNYDITETLATFQRELTNTITQLISSKNNELRQDLREDMKELKCQIRDVEQKFNTLAEDHSLSKQNIAKIEVDLESNKSHLNAFETKITFLKTTVETISKQLQIKEQQGRLNNIEISGVPLRKAENLYSILSNIATKVNFPIEPMDIDFIHRVRRYENTSLPNIVVKFTQRRRKAEMLNAVRIRRGLTTADAGIDGEAKPIFVNEHLAPHTKLLHKNVRQFVKEHHFKYIWINEGKIFIRKSDTSKAIHVSSSDFLQTLA